MGWFDEEIAMEQAANSGGTGDINANLGDDLAEAVQMLGDSSSQDWIQFAITGISNTSGYAQRQGIGDAPRPAESDKPAEKKEAGGILGRISNFVDKNKALSEMLLKGVAGAAIGNQAKRTAELQAQSRLDELKLRNQQEREKDAQVSASVSGLRVPDATPSPGLINLARKRNEQWQRIYGKA